MGSAAAAHSVLSRLAGHTGSWMAAPGGCDPGLGGFPSELKLRAIPEAGGGVWGSEGAGLRAPQLKALGAPGRACAGGWRGCRGLKARPAGAGGSRGAPPSDFSHEYTGLKVKIPTTTGVIEGVLAGASRYWFKLVVGGTVYVNKAHVIIVTPEP